MLARVRRAPADRVRLAAPVALAGVAFLIWAVLSDGNAALAVTGFALLVLSALGREAGRPVVGIAAASVFGVVALVWGATGDRGIVADGVVPAMLVLAALAVIASLRVPRGAAAAPDADFDERLRRELLRATAEGRPLALITCGFDFSTTLATTSAAAYAELRRLVQRLAAADDLVDAQDDVVVWAIPGVGVEAAERRCGLVSEAATAELDTVVHCGVVVAEEGTGVEALRREAAAALDFARLRQEAMASASQLAP